MDKKISKYEIANCINVLGNFCGKRDIDELTAFELMKKYGVEKADVMVLFGGSILAGGDILANAMKNDVAKKCYCWRKRTYNSLIGRTVL